MSAISSRQNEPDMIDLLRAASVLHLRAQRIEAARTSVCLLLAAAGVLAATVRATVPVIACLGAAWAVILATGVGPWAKRLNVRAAVFQEVFDTELYELPWNRTAAGSPPTAYERHQLVRGFPASREARLRDWYVDSTGIPRPYDIFLCQQQNLGWDSRLRRRWAYTLMSVIVAWSLTGLGAGYLGGLTVVETAVSWFVPSLGALILGFEGYRAQLDIAAERERVVPFVQETLAQASPSARSPAADRRLLATAREVQDVILATRRQPARVPDWFYAYFRDTDAQDFQSGARALRDRFSRP